MPERWQMETQSWQPPVLLSRKHPSSASTVVSRKRIGSPSRTRVAVDAHDFAVENCHCALVERKSLYDTGRAWVIVEEHRERYIRNRVLNQLRMQGEEIGCFGRLMNAVVNGRDRMPPSFLRQLLRSDDLGLSMARTVHNRPFLQSAQEDA